MKKEQVSIEANLKVEVYCLDSGYIVTGNGRTAVCSRLVELGSVIASVQTTIPDAPLDDIDEEALAGGLEEEDDAEDDLEEEEEEDHLEEEEDFPEVEEEELEDDDPFEDDVPSAEEMLGVPEKPQRLSWSDEDITRMVQLYVDEGLGRKGIHRMISHIKPGSTPAKVGAILDSLHRESRSMPSSLDDYVERFLNEYGKRRSKERVD